MRDICHQHSALLSSTKSCTEWAVISGTLHVWQAEDVVPDIQTMAKGLGAGYQSIAAMMISDKIVEWMTDKSGQFIHGLSYQWMSVQAAAALEVERIIQQHKLIDYVSKQGT